MRQWFVCVFDVTGNRASMQVDFVHVAHGGNYVLVGVVQGNLSFSDPEFHKDKIPLAKIITPRSSLSEVAIDLPVWTTNKTGLIKALIATGE